MLGIWQTGGEVWRLGFLSDLRIAAVEVGHRPNLPKVVRPFEQGIGSQSAEKSKAS